MNRTHFFSGGSSHYTGTTGASSGRSGTRCHSQCSRCPSQRRERILVRKTKLINKEFKRKIRRGLTQPDTPGLSFLFPFFDFTLSTSSAFRTRGSLGIQIDEKKQV